ncbi:MAG: glucoamylase family protein [Acidobacteriota bacterium]
MLRFLKRFTRAPEHESYEEPIRDELFSVERLEQYAAELAAGHVVSSEARRGRSLLSRLEENGQRLIVVYRALADAIRKESTVSPAAEWLVDNFHIVEEQLREIRRDLPRGYYRELPKLQTGELADYPRVYAIALALIAHTDSRLDSETLTRFVRSYQHAMPLSIGELWAIAITLRLALVENLRRLGVRIVEARNAREDADRLAERLLEIATRQPNGLTAALEAAAGKGKRLDRAFFVQLAQRLRDQDPEVWPALDWLEKRLAAESATVEQVVHLEHQRQAAAQATVGNIITSMRLLSTLDWNEFFESLSLVEPILAEDPVGAYASMDFMTRDRYRHVIEKIARRTKTSELDVARLALRLAARSHSKAAGEQRRAHVGFYLLDWGRAQLEKEAGFRPRLHERFFRWMLKHPTVTYLGSFFFLTALILGLCLLYAHVSGASPGALIAIGLLLLVPVSDLALTALNLDVAALFKPHPLSKMNTAAGVPEVARTFVVIPTIFSSEQTVRSLLESLEVHYLANRDENIYFALLGDFADAPREDMPEDDRLLDVAIKGVEDLNARYDKDQSERFCLFHRRRKWNAGEGKWIGWERKRGKLHEFNRLLCGALDTSYIVSTAGPAFLSRFRYVITLDSDTQLPRDAARRLIGTALHPLNQPRLDPLVNRVTEGYAILQPRVSMTLPSSSRSRFARIFSGHTGVDPYTTAVSDVYQDLFGEGSYTGKGLYVVDSFESALADRVPENLLLSHDLFESLYARAALVTDIELLDEYPSHYDSYAKRQHRWTRGDWQIARWLFPRVRDAHNRPVPNTLPLISRWKILDNLRRSLVAPTMLLWLAAAWTVLPGSPLLWTLAVLAVVAFPVYAHVTNALMVHPRGIPWTSHFWSIWGDARTNAAQVALSLALIPHQAYLQVHAIAITFYRKLISKKKLLEWVTAAQTESGSAHDLQAFWRMMWPAEVPVLFIAVALSVMKPAAFALAAPFLVVWAVSPVIAYWVSFRLPKRDESLSEDEKVLVRLVARRTWKFFEAFVGEDDHWLPPDNYQEDPKAVVAHRTSPTDIGMFLLATAAARDFGYLATLEMAERLELTLATMERLDRFHGHFLNWYDTTTLLPLTPQYVSTVDSGNLAGHLIALKQACVEIAEQPLFEARVIEGLTDTILLMREEADNIGAVRQSTGAVTLKQLRGEIESCAALLSNDASNNAPETLSKWAALFQSMTERVVQVEDMIGALSHEHGDGKFDQVHSWTYSLMHQLREHRRDLNGLAPWSLAFSPAVSAPITSCSEEIASEWKTILGSLDRVPTLDQVAPVCADAVLKLSALRITIDQCPGDKRQKALKQMDLVLSQIAEVPQAAGALAARYAEIARRCDSITEAMDFGFLFAEDRRVFVIGYNVTDGRRDNSYYDLLASESRLASFVAIAKGDVPQEHWFRLGRGLTQVDGSRALISWTATMFEYLMPLLVMRGYPDTLLDQTYHAIVVRQIEYGGERGVPWGVSEAGYNARDLQLNYQYGPFGVPGLGLKRGLGDDLVVSPYSTALAAMVEPRAALENMNRLIREGALTRYGFYEAIDYTEDRLQPDQKSILVKAFMIHHQGMTLVALDNLLHGNVMQRRFHSEPLVQATELLLQERIPREVPLDQPRREKVRSDGLRMSAPVADPRRFETANLPTPRTQLLSNGVYSVVVTTAGSGYSVCDGLAVTRWREDVTRDNWGSFCYLRDVRSGAVWSAGHLPVPGKPQSYEVALAEDKAEFRRSDAGIVTHTEIIVSPEDNTEVRQISVTNNTTRPRDIELTSYMEVVLAAGAADAAHPAFSNLFIETEFIPSEAGLLASRRCRSPEDKEVWGWHIVIVDGETVGAVQYETDRARFLGRGHTTADPIAVMEGRPLSNTVGAVLDPIFSLRQRVRLGAQERARVTFATGLAHSRDEALRLADKYHNPYAFDREAGLAWTKVQVEMRHLQMDADEAHLFQRLAGRLLYSDPSLRPRPRVLALNTKDQSGLWPYGISGDLPIALVRISQEEDLSMVRQLLRGHEYLRLKGLVFDLVILNDHPPSYIQSLQDELQRLVRISGSHALMDKPGGVFLRRTDLMPEADRILLHTVARVGIVADRGPLEEQLVQRPAEDDLPPRFVARAASRKYPEEALRNPELAFFNGLGGFIDGGREYATILNEGQWTPAPWLNVISNSKDFGFQISEAGVGYTWSVNSRENRLTPWSNDPVSDPAGEAIYLRDEDTGEVWSPTPLPIREPEQYLIRHGQGYSIFQHASHGIDQELMVFVPMDSTVKISLLRLRNQTDRKRRISVTSYAEWVLGVDRSRMAPYIITEVDKDTGAVFARNPFNNEFSHRVAFADMSEPQRTITCDRKEFLGRNGSPASPAALRRAELSGRAGAGLDPCAAIQAVIELAPSEAREVVIILGEAETAEEARAIAVKYRQVSVATEAIEKVVAQWDDLLNVVEVKTPDSTMDIMLNRWLVYQALSCRIWGRSAFYQSGGAYGFRDQLQDVCALVYAQPAIAREQILRAAAHQFKEGDVQHWWHPPTGRGVRTRCSDDLLWLPFVTSFYVEITGDQSVFEETVPFLEAPVLAEGETEAYLQSVISSESASLYEHCVRALDRSLAAGTHGLPLMGSGDWNDGMNRVGKEGKGESIWLGWFLHDTLGRFAQFCDSHKDKQRGDKYRRRMEKLNQALEDHGWDGGWYRRAYFDDGTPLGSAQNEECRIDSIAQSWGVISGAAQLHRATRAMAAVEEYLIRRGDGLAILFTPPFDKSALDPGYIKGYVPGVRENGGQYTHAALWTLMAYAKLGDGDRAGELFTLLNPINHASTRAGLHKYKVEPYVVAADVYAVWPHTGRGGWTWYTGAAGWMYRAGLESILGFKLRGDRLQIDPCIPRSWREYEITYKRGTTTYQIVVDNPHGLNRGFAKIEVDGKQLATPEIELVDDGKQHNVRVTLEMKTADE